MGQLATADTWFRTCRTSSFCTVAWQLARFQLTRCIARSLGDSWASCLYMTGHCNLYCTSAYGARPILISRASSFALGYGFVFTIRHRSQSYDLSASIYIKSARAHRAGCWVPRQVSETRSASAVNGSQLCRWLCSLLSVAWHLRHRMFAPSPTRPSSEAPVAYICGEGTNVESLACQPCEHRSIDCIAFSFLLHSNVISLYYGCNKVVISWLPWIQLFWVCAYATCVCA